MACRAVEVPVAATHRVTTHHALAEALRPRAFFAQFGSADEVTAATAGLGAVNAGLASQ